MTVELRSRPARQLRVVPGARGQWRIEDESSVRARCGTFAEAEALAMRLGAEAGGEVLVYDAYRRLHAVKRPPGMGRAAGWSVPEQPG